MGLCRGSADALLQVKIPMVNCTYTQCCELVDTWWSMMVYTVASMQGSVRGGINTLGLRMRLLPPDIWEFRYHTLPHSFV